MFTAKIISGCWIEGTLTLGDMPEDFVLSARKVIVLEVNEYDEMKALCRKLAEALKEIVKHEMGYKKQRSLNYDFLVNDIAKSALEAAKKARIIT